MARQSKLEPLRLLDHIARHPSRSRRERAADLGVGTATIGRTIHKLINEFEKPYINPPQGKHRVLELTKDGRTALEDWKQERSANAER